MPRKQLPKINLNVQIVRSTMPILSSMGAESALAILVVLKKHYVQAGITIVNNAADLQALVDSKPDLVFLGAKYVPSDCSPDGKVTKIWISEYLDAHGISCTGSSHTAHRLELSKHEAKQAVLDAGLCTSVYAIVKRNQAEKQNFSHLKFPLFVKPTDKGGGVGVDSNSVVRNIDELRIKIDSVTTENLTDSLVEQYLTGREFSVAIILDKSSGAPKALPIEIVIEPDLNGNSIRGRLVKKADEEIVLMVEQGEVFEKISTLAIKSFEALGGRDYGRIDIRMDDSGVPHFLEANLIPSLLEDYGSFPAACMLNLNLEYEPMILDIVDIATARAATV